MLEGKCTKESIRLENPDQVPPGRGLSPPLELPHHLFVHYFIGLSVREDAGNGNKSVEGKS